MASAQHSKQLALQAVQQGQAAQALQHMRAACEAEPQSAALRCELGCLYAHFGQLGEAVAELQASLQLDPTYAPAWHFLGISLARLGRNEEALPALRRAYALRPDHPGTLDALARLEFLVGYPADALPLWQALAQARPGQQEIVLKLGETLSRLGRHAEARQCFLDALARDPTSAELAMALGQAEEDLGQRDAAEAAYERALAHRPGWAFPLAGVLGLRRAQAAPARVGEAQAALFSGSLPPADQALLGYELGKVFDGRGEHRQAMVCWDAANAARRREAGDYDLADLESRVDNSLAAFNAQAFVNPPPGASHADDRLVFVVGMPRSGTTLTEQIIAAHPRAHGAGELPDMALVSRHLPGRSARAAAWPHIPESFPQDLSGAAERYLQAASRDAGGQVLRLVDKSPLNYHQLGLVALLFPRARVVWCRRDPRDIAISIYGENFAMGERFATRLDGIGHWIRLQEKTMRHWQQVLPLPILQLSYESLVTDLEPQARRLLDFCGLDWDPACLDFHRSQRGVQTPSRWQVRQPVHTRSVGRWRNYQFALDPLLSALGPAGAALTP
ncbi:tetratricopeptide repeat-containing sulfotransferase family protein [Arenimonas sp. MALMAid1274]|uniref:tetratricopeptide repeat-containing sulfotransferase family protein n=1 Tax=Arenimonas sp. MALMAid1274 TaxID=3411630 RepID=UPI003BA23213